MQLHVAEPEGGKGFIIGDCSIWKWLYSSLTHIHIRCCVNFSSSGFLLVVVDWILESDLHVVRVDLCPSALQKKSKISVSINLHVFLYKIRLVTGYISQHLDPVTSLKATSSLVAC